MLNVVSPNATFIIDVYLNTPSGPFMANTPVTYYIRDFNGNLVLNGSGIQDVVNTARWYSTVTLPATVPIGDDTQKYSLTWVGQGVSSLTVTELFQVVPTTDYTFIENDKVALEMGSVNDSLILPASIFLTDLTASIIDQNGKTLYSIAVSPIGITMYDKLIYNFSSGALYTLMADGNGMRPYVVQWNYSASGVSYPPEFHFIYVVNTKMLLAMNDVRRMVNKARNEDININLQYSDIDLIQYIQIGLQRVNSCPPQFSSFTISNIPIQFQGLLTYAAAYETLSAQALAEGQSSFDLSGQSVTLNVDRTPSIEAAMGRIDTYIEANLSRTKKLWAKMGGGSGISAGVLGLSIGPTTNRIIYLQGEMSRIRALGGSQGNVF